MVTEFAIIIREPAVVGRLARSKWRCLFEHYSGRDLKER